MGPVKSMKLDGITEITVPVSGRVSYDDSKIEIELRLEAYTSNQEQK